MAKDCLTAIMRLEGIELARGKSYKRSHSESELAFYGSVQDFQSGLFEAGIAKHSRTGSAFFCDIEFSDRPSVSVPSEIQDEAIGWLEVPDGDRFVNLTSPDSRAGRLKMRISLPSSELSTFFAICNAPIRVEPIFHRNAARELTVERSGDVHYLYIERVYFTPLLSTE